MRLEKLIKRTTKSIDLKNASKTQRVNSPSHRVGAILSGDVDVSGFDINQCDDHVEDDPPVHHHTAQIRQFADTHKCHHETSKVGCLLV